jgi:hypothetical protein
MRASPEDSFDFEPNYENDLLLYFKYGSVPLAFTAGTE